ncbi:hypothetical protein L1987_23480 [Smallanthus sonchifolius]|uniref:Uncharacterized protein n=1 Tax=Smallanthus sonchifolius TaxID=185202 RepID=A0ACB9IJ82_9ASTR|nr:hypothetical protein L1987_23480 [Smallanthus sonchifolius]
MPGGLASVTVDEEAAVHELVVVANDKLGQGLTLREMGSGRGSGYWQWRGHQVEEKGKRNSGNKMGQQRGLSLSMGQCWVGQKKGRDGGGNERKREKPKVRPARRRSTGSVWGGWRQDD